jgi:predicted  nucleic acid-binding Zn ribbon protein
MPWFTILCNRKRTVSRDKYEDQVEDWLGTLERFEYIYEERSAVWVADSKMEVIVNATRMDSLEPKHFNKYTRLNFEKMAEISDGIPKVSLREHKPRKKWPTWKTAKELYLYTDYVREGLPVKEGRKGIGIPIYQLPIEPDQAEQIAFWAIRYRRLDGVQLGCGELEIPAYRQLAEVKSVLSRSGREACQLIEKATGKPTYYFLHRYWGWESEDKETNRRCPSCGGNWHNKAKSKHGIGRFVFKCESCRLVSERCSSTENKKYAEIGTWNH